MIYFTSSDFRLRNTWNWGRKLFKTSGVAYSLDFSWLAVKEWGWLAVVKSLLGPGTSEDILLSVVHLVTYKCTE